jgi:hypothetical protein
MKKCTHNTRDQQMQHFGMRLSCSENLEEDDDDEKLIR